MNEKPAIESKTIIANTACYAIVHILQYMGFEVSVELVLDFMLIGNILLRLVTGKPLTTAQK